MDRKLHSSSLQIRRKETTLNIGRRLEYNITIYLKEIRWVHVMGLDSFG